MRPDEKKKADEHEIPLPGTDDAPECDPDPDPCCCPVVGCATVEVDVVYHTIDARMEITQRRGLDTHGNLAAAPQQQPAVNGDAAARLSLFQSIEKPKDPIIGTVRYRVFVSAHGGCPPYTFDVYTAGDVDSAHRCVSDGIEVVRTRIGDDLSDLGPSGLGYRVVVRDSKGGIDSFSGRVPGPV